MKVFSMIVALILFFCIKASAGEMFGAITDGDKAVGEKIKIDVTVAGKTYSAETDKNGTYRLFVKEKGKGVFALHYKDQTPAADVFSYDKSLRYDWVIEHKDGKLQLKRK
jgi:hypothetical protein